MNALGQRSYEPYTFRARTLAGGGPSTTPSVATTLKVAVAACLAEIPGIGTIDLAQLDPDGLPRKLRGTTPYWGLSLSAVNAMPPQPAGLGGGSVSRHQFMGYRLRLEGWRGFVAVADITADWESLVEAVVDKLLLCVQPLAVAVPGLRDITNVGAEVGVPLELRDREKNDGRGYRAHHATVLADFEFYRVLIP